MYPLIEECIEKGKMLFQELIEQCIQQSLHCNQTLPVLLATLLLGVKELFV